MASYRKVTLSDGSVSYNFRVVKSGFPTVYKSFPTLKEGKAWATDIEAKQNRGKAGITDPSKVLIADALDEFVSRHSAINKKEQGRIQLLKADFKDFAISSLTHERVQKYLKILSETPIPSHPKKKKSHVMYNGDVVKTYAPATIRKYYYQLKKCVEWHAAFYGYYLQPHVFENQQSIPAAWAGKRERRLEAGEEEKLYATALTGYKQKQEWQDIIAFALETAMRTQEILFVTVSNFNSDGRTLNIPKDIVKTEKARQIPLSKRAMEIITRYTANKEGADIHLDLILTNFFDSTICDGYKSTGYDAQLMAVRG